MKVQRFLEVSGKKGKSRNLLCCWRKTWWVSRRRRRDSHQIKKGQDTEVEADEETLFTQTSSPIPAT